MRTIFGFIACMVLCTGTSLAAPKRHVVSLGKWTSVKWLPDDSESTALDLRIRPLYVDGRTKEFSLGPAHDVTERTFLVQRMFRLNDSLPAESSPPHWRWNAADGCSQTASLARSSSLRYQSVIPIRQP